MTITAQTSKTGPYNGNGTTTVFSYTFRVQDETQLEVTVLASDGITETTKVLNTDYTVTGVGNNSGGTVVMGTAPVTGEKLTITRNVTLDQVVDLQNRGSVNPETLEASFDKLTQIAQDQQEQLDRSLKVDLFEQADLEQLTLNVNALAAIEGDISTVAGISSDVTDVAGNAADISTVAGISADVTAVVADATDIGTVSTNIANVNTVAGISADVTAVAADATDIGTVSTNIANVNTVAGISSDVTTVATNVTDITNFSNVYLGPKTTDPSTRNDSSALQEGDLYFNTTSDVMKVYEGSVWVAAYVSLSGALLSINDLSDVSDAAASRTNLGLGTNDSPTFTSTIVTGAGGAGTVQSNIGNSTLSTGSAILYIGASRTGDGQARIDMIGDTTYAPGLRILRNSGANGSTLLQHRGTGAIAISAIELADIAFKTNNLERMRISSAGLVGIGTSSPTEMLSVAGNISVTGTVDGRDIAADGATLDSLAAPTSPPVYASAHGISSGADSATELQAAIDTNAPVIVIDVDCRLDSPVTLNNDNQVIVVNATVYQYGSGLFTVAENVHAPAIIGNGVIDGTNADAGSFAIRTGAVPNLTVDLLFQEYAAANLLLVMPTSAASTNTFGGNIRLRGAALAGGAAQFLNGIVLIGREAYHHAHTADGTTDPITAPYAWPELNNGSVVVHVQALDGSWSVLEVDTDFTLAYDGSDQPVVTPLSATTSGDIWHIWPAQPVTTGNRRPISSMKIEMIGDAIKHGILIGRWADGLKIGGLIRRVTDAATAVRFNPYNASAVRKRTGQAGDNIHFTDLITTDGTSSGTPAAAVSLGAGSYKLTGGIGFDGSGYSSLQIVPADCEFETLTGTASSSGAVVTGTGTAFLTELTLVGSNADKIVNTDGQVLSISSIDSDTQITLTATPTTTMSGATLKSKNIENVVSGQIMLSSDGDGLAYGKPYADRLWQWPPRRYVGIATVTAGLTSVTVTFPEPLARAPVIGEVQVTADENTGLRHWAAASSFTRESIVVSQNATAGGDRDYAVSVNLFDA